MPDSVDPRGLRCELDGPLAIASGRTARHGLLLTNLGGGAVTVNTNGNLTAWVLDPATGETVGGFSGAQRLPLVRFTVAPGETVRIPLLVGTASFLARLGYAVPPGRWQLTAPLDLADGRHLVTPPLDITITPPSP